MKLYLFMKAEYLLSCLENDEIKVILPEGCNDPFEFKPREKMGKTPHDTDGVGMICLSEECTSTTMWAHYADKHQGVCLEFSFNKAKRKIKYDTSDNEGDSQASKVAIIEVKRPYVKQFTELPRPAGKTGASSFIPLMMKVKYSPYRAYPAENKVYCELQGKPLPPRYSRLYAAKGMEWAYEKEWRLLVTLDNCLAYHDGCYFVKGLTRYITKVMLGIKCELPKPYVQHVLDSVTEHHAKCVKMEADDMLFAVHPMRKTAKKVSPVWCPNLEIEDAIWQKLWKEAQAQKLPSPESLIIKLIKESITPSKKTNR